MTNNDDKLVSAQVVVKAHSAAGSQEVMQHFQRRGFEVGPLFANSFSIAAPRGKFETYFKPKSGSSSSEGISVNSIEESVLPELPLDAVPSSVREKIETIVFSKPPDFGPGGNY